MTIQTSRAALAAAAFALSVAACHRQPDVAGIPVVQNNPATIPDNQAAYAAAAAERADALRASMNDEANANASAALKDCAPDVCSALGRHELAIGMTRPQVLVATNSSAAAWQMRGTTAAGTMLPSYSSGRQIKDRVGEVVMVTFRDGKAISYTYRESTGLRTVESPADATVDGRRHALALSILQQGDEAVAAGNSAEALARYDQADVIEPNNPGTTLRIAKLLDQQMRPVEALMRYQKFLHEMEIDKINARGRANAELSGAVMAAQARVVHLQETITNK